jgi:hypothetical protein
MDNIPYSLIKGETLSYYMYGEYGLRLSADIDIITDYSYLTQIEKILVNEGFDSNNKIRSNRVFCLNNSHQLLPYFKKIALTNIDIDINFDLFWGESEKHINIEEFVSDSHYADIYGIMVKILKPEKAFIQLILHHYREMNSIFLLYKNNKIKERLFYEINRFLLRAHNEKFLTNVLTESVRYGVAEYVYYILYFTCLIYNNEITSLYKEAFNSYKDENMIGYYGLSTKEQKKWNIDPIKRLTSDNIFENIKENLTEKDFDKIRVNRLYF